MNPPRRFEANGSYSSPPTHRRISSPGSKRLPVTVKSDGLALVHGSTTG